MIEIRKVRWKNFLSYGDYDSSLDLQYPGSCLITGEIEEDQSTTEAKKSNGSGKSTIPNAILWGLFGRTMHSTSAGDSIINHFTKKTCEVTIDFKNGDQIIRRRNPGGSTELFYIRDGNECNLVADTVSTAKAMQAQLNRVFQLDFEIFCNSVFFNQYGRPWMEMSEVTRKKALEKILRVDRFSFYSNIAKAKTESAQTLYQNVESKLVDCRANRDKLLNDIESYKSESANYEIKRRSKLDEIDKVIASINGKMSEVKVPDIDKLTEKWNIIEKIKSNIDSIKAEDLKLFKEIAAVEAKVNVFKKKRTEVQALDGKRCVTCNQDIPNHLVKGNLDKIDSEIKEYEDSLKDLNDKRMTIQSDVDKYEKLLKSKIPSLTLVEARGMSTLVLNYQSEINRLSKMRQEVESDQDPNQKFIDRLTQNVQDLDKKIEELTVKSQEYVLLEKHYNYLYKSYNDRNKVKSFMCEEHLPYINNRLEHYLNILNLDIRIKIENDLKITSNMWGYDYQSGGERKRTDLAFMLACFDFYEMMYGRQCNLMVLDEVDGRMDEDGIEGLINIIRNELISRVDNILVISHRNQMFDVFDKEIKVKRVNRLSMLVGN